MKVRRFYGLGGRAGVRYCGEGYRTTYMTKAMYVYDDGDIVDLEEDDATEEEATWDRVEWDAEEDDVAGTPREVAAAFLRRMDLGKYLSPEKFDVSDVLDELRVAFYDENPATEVNITGEGETIYTTFAEVTLRRCDGKPLSKLAMRHFYETLYEGTRGSGYAAGPQKPSWYPSQMKPKAWTEAEERERRKEKEFKTQTRARVGYDLDGLAGRVTFPRCVPRFNP